MKFRNNLFVLALVLGMFGAISVRASESENDLYLTNLSVVSLPRLLFYRGSCEAVTASSGSKAVVDLVAVAAGMTLPVASWTLEKQLFEELKDQSSDCRMGVTQVLLIQREINLRSAKAMKSVLKIVENLDPKQLRAASTGAAGTPTGSKLAAQ